jgi:hypothetical protein
MSTQEMSTINVLLNGEKSDNNINNSSTNCVKTLDNNSSNSLETKPKDLNNSLMASTSISLSETTTSTTLKNNCLKKVLKLENNEQNCHQNNSFVKRKSLHLSKPSLISVNDNNKRKLESKDLIKIKRKNNSNNCEIKLSDNKIKGENHEKSTNDKNNNLSLTQVTNNSIELKSVNKLLNESKNCEKTDEIEVKTEELKTNNCSDDCKPKLIKQSIDSQTNDCKYESNLIKNNSNSELTLKRSECNASQNDNNMSKTNESMNKLMKQSSKQLTSSMCAKCRRKSVSNVRIQCKMDQYLSSRIQSLPASISLSLLTPRLPLPASDLLNLKYGKYYRVEHYPNGMAKILHLYWDEIIHLSLEEKNELSQEFLKESFREETPNVAKYVISVVHNAASYLPDLLEWFASHEPNLTVKAGVLGHSGSDIETTTMQTYRDNVFNILFIFNSKFY